MKRILAALIGVGALAIAAPADAYRLSPDDCSFGALAPRVFQNGDEWFNAVAASTGRFTNPAGHCLQTKTVSLHRKGPWDLSWTHVGQRTVTGTSTARVTDTKHCGLSMKCFTWQSYHYSGGSLFYAPTW